MDVPVRRPQTISRRILAVMAVFACGYGALAARLAYLQALRSDHYREQAWDIRGRLLPLDAVRGDILERSGEPLARTREVGRLVCDPTMVDDPGGPAALLAPIVHMPAATLVRAMAPAVGKPRRYAVLADDLDADQVEAVEAKLDARATRRTLAGFAVETRAERSYPEGREAAHPVGFVVPGPGGVPRGMMGLEQSLDPLLRGTPGRVLAEVDARKRVIAGTQRERKDPVNGTSVRLTLDSRIQHIAAAALAECVARHHPRGATAIVLDPVTGDVLALVSYPDLDPVTREELARGDAPLANHAIWLVEPGSTMKPVTVAIALETGAIGPQTTFQCPGTRKIGGRNVRCVLHGDSERNGHGTVTAHDVVEHSCNIGAGLIGVRVGMERMAEELEAFGLLDPTGVGLPAEPGGTLGFGSERRSGGEAKVSRVAFGQSVMVTPLGLVAAYGAFANGGELVAPRLVAATRPDGKPERAAPPSSRRRVLRPEVAALVRGYLGAVVSGGTGRSASVPGYTVYGKTGTAQKVRPGSRGYTPGAYVASFVGFLPEQPRAVIGVVVDEPRDGHYGAQVAGPVFREIGRQLMWYWKVAPDDPASLAQGTREAQRGRDADD